MKRILALAFMAMFVFTAYASARVQYDSTGRNIMVDNTIRGQRRPQPQTVVTQQRVRGAAAARIYNDGINSSHTYEKRTTRASRR